jgi:hypothetical protein
MMVLANPTRRVLVESTRILDITGSCQRQKRRGVVVEGKASGRDSGRTVSSERKG